MLITISSLKNAGTDDIRTASLPESSPAQPWRPNSSMFRIAEVAAETGSRFVRERINQEPMLWMLQPRQLFEGRTAIEACCSEEGYRRAMLLHGLSLGLDALPEHLENIPLAAVLPEREAKGWTSLPPSARSPKARRGGPPTLFTCTISSSLEETEVHIFCAMVARSEDEVRRRLRHRYGPLLEDEACVRRGFDWSEPLACSMVSDAMADLLRLAAEEPTSSIADGLDFQVEQRFVA